MDLSPFSAPSHHRGHRTVGLAGRRRRGTTRRNRLCTHILLLVLAVLSLVLPACQPLHNAVTSPATKPTLDSYYSARSRFLGGPAFIHYRDGQPVEASLDCCRRLAEEDVAVLREYPSLEKVCIIYPECKGSWLVYLKDLPALNYLCLDNTSVDNDGLARFSGSKSLKSLLLAENKNVTAEGMKVVATMLNLELLYVHGVKIGDEGLAHLTALKKLKYLDLERSGVTDNGVKFLKDFPSLDTVFISPGVGLTQQAIDRIRSELPQVKFKSALLPWGPDALGALRQPSLKTEKKDNDS